MKIAISDPIRPTATGILGGELSGKRDHE